MQSQSIYISLLALFMDSSSSSYFSVQNSIGKNSAWHSFSTTSEKPLLVIFRKKPDAIIISQNPCGFPPVITFLHKNFPAVGRFVFLASSSTTKTHTIISRWVRTQNSMYFIAGWMKRKKKKSTKYKKVDTWLLETSALNLNSLCFIKEFSKRQARLNFRPWLSMPAYGK